jgi:purine nucleosidase
MNAVNLPSKRSVPVLFDHDGSADDFLSLLLLLSMAEVELLGVSITPADCYAENALETTLKLLQLHQRVEVPVSVGQFHGVNAFPAAWRAKPRILNALPALITLSPSPAQVDPRPSPLVLRDLLAAATHPVTVLLTGPCSTLVHALALAPELAARIGHVVWMGGAVDVVGNVQTYNHDGSAEWNVFWDPEAASHLLALRLPLTLIPLDVTNEVPVDWAFLQQVARQASHPLVNLAGQFWATTTDTIPAYAYTYFMWDVLATSYLAIPDAFEVERLELAVVSSGPSAGQTYRQAGSEQWVNVAKRVDKPRFYAYLLQQLQAGPAAPVAG